MGSNSNGKNTQGDGKSKYASPKSKRGPVDRLSRRSFSSPAINKSNNKRSPLKVATQDSQADLNLIDFDESIQHDQPLELSNDQLAITSNGSQLDQLDDDALKQVFMRLSTSDMLKCARWSKRCKRIVREIISCGTLDVNWSLLTDLSDRSKKFTNFKGDQQKDEQQLDPRDPQRLREFTEHFYSKATTLAVDIGAKLDPIYMCNLLNLHNTLRCLILCHKADYDECFCKPRVLTKFEQLETIKLGSSTKVGACWLLDLVTRSPRLTTVRICCNFANTHHTDAFLTRTFPSSIKQIHWSKTKLCGDDEIVIDFLVKHSPDLDVFDSPIQMVSNLCSQQKLRNITRLSLRLNDVWYFSRENRNLLRQVKYLSQLRNLQALELRSFDFYEDLGGDARPDQDADERCKSEMDTYKKMFFDTLANCKNLKALALYGSWEFNKTCRRVAKCIKNVEYIRINLLPASIKDAMCEAESETRILNIGDALSNLKRLDNLKGLTIMCSEYVNHIEQKSLDRLQSEMMDKIWSFDFRLSVTDEIEQFLFELHKRGQRVGRTYSATLSIQSKTKSTNQLTYFRVELLIGYGHSGLKSITEFHEEIDRLILNRSTELGRKSGHTNVVMTKLQLIQMKDCQAYRECVTDWDKYLGAFKFDKRYFI